MEKLLKDDSGANVGDIERKASEKRREIFLRGVLSVTVMSAENLPVMDLGGKSDPYVVVILRKAGIKKKTRVYFLSDNCLPFDLFIFLPSP